METESCIRARNDDRGSGADHAGRGSETRDGMYTTKITLASHMRKGTSDGDAGHGHSSGGLDFMDAYGDTEYSYQKNSTRTIIALIVAIVIVAAILGAITFSMFVFSENSNIEMPDPVSVRLGINNTLTPAQSLHYASKWLLSQQDSQYAWSNTPQALIGLRLANPDWFISKDLESQLSIRQMTVELLEEMLQSTDMITEEGVRYKDFKMSTGNLATYINAMSASCLSNTDFHGYSLIQSLDEAMLQFSNSDLNERNCYYFSLGILALCNADHKILNDYIIDMKSYQLADGGYQYGIDATSMVVVALSCLSNNKKRKTDVRNTMQDAVNYILHQQTDDGGFGSVLNTANAVQALLASNIDSESTRVKNALKYITQRQNEDGSFGSVSETSQIIPVLALMTYADIKKVANCDEEAPTELDSLDDLIVVFLSVKSGLLNETVTIEPMTFAVTVSAGSSLYDVFVRADEQHEVFSFTTSEFGKWGHPLIAINGQHETPGITYWAIFTAEGAETSLGLDDIIPQDEDTIMLIYTATGDT